MCEVIGLTTMAQPALEQGQVAATMLLDVPRWERAQLPLLSTPGGELLAAGDRNGACRTLPP